MPTKPETHRRTPTARVQPDRAPWRRWYTRAQWRTLRATILERDAYICRVCGVPAGESGEVDHVRPHRGDWDLFTDLENLQTLCKRCHSRKTQGGQ